MIHEDMEHYSLRFEVKTGGHRRRKKIRINKKFRKRYGTSIRLIHKESGMDFFQFTGHVTYEEGAVIIQSIIDHETSSEIPRFYR